MILLDRMKGVLQRLGSPYGTSYSPPPLEPFDGESVIAALEAIEIRLAGIDAHLQHRTDTEREEDLIVLAGLAGITFDTDAGLDDQPGQTLPVKAID